LEIFEADAPWLFKDGEASRRIATSEMFASLLCLWLFTADIGDGGAGGLVLSGLTDNAGNSAILTKMSTSKMPVAPVLLEMAKIMYSRRLEFSLLWTPREENVLADALTNGEFEGFDPSQRKVFTLSQALAAFPDLLRYTHLHESFELQLEELKLKKRASAQAEKDHKGPRFKKRKKVTEKQPW
jgi:hypothetical protein